MAMVAKALVTVVATAALASGCALTDVTLHPPPSFEVAAGSRRGAGREIFVVRPFRDARSDVRCGMKKNGFNMETATVLCATPARLIADLVAHQLALAGFRVLRDRRDAGPSAIILTGALEQVFDEAKNNFFSVEFETDVALRLWATTPDGLSAERRFYVKGDEATLFGSDDDLQRSFDAGVRQLVIEVVGAMANLAEKYPPLPSSVPPLPLLPSPAAATRPQVKLDGAAL